MCENDMRHKSYYVFNGRAAVMRTLAWAPAPALGTDENAQTRNPVAANGYTDITGRLWLLYDGAVSAFLDRSYKYQGTNLQPPHFCAWALFTSVHEVMPGRTRVGNWNVPGPMRRALLLSIRS